MNNYNHKSISVNVNELRALIAYKSLTYRQISKGIKRSYNTVCLVLRGKRKSDRILGEIFGFVIGNKDQ